MQTRIPRILYPQVFVVGFVFVAFGARRLHAQVPDSTDSDSLILVGIVETNVPVLTCDSVSVRDESSPCRTAIPNPPEFYSVHQFSLLPSTPLRHHSGSLAAFREDQIDLPIDVSGIDWNALMELITGQLRSGGREVAFSGSTSGELLVMTKAVETTRFRSFYEVRIVERYCDRASREVCGVYGGASKIVIPRDGSGGAKTYIDVFTAGLETTAVNYIRAAVRR